MRYATGALLAIGLLLLLKYVVFGEKQWNDLLAPLHRAMPNNIKDSTGTP